MNDAETRLLEIKDRVLAFAIEFANVSGIDIAAIIEAKMKRNAETEIYRRNKAVWVVAW